MTDEGHGKTYGRFTLSTAQAAALKKALWAIAAPKHQAANGVPKPEEPQPSPERLGEAFAEYVERYSADRLPNAGEVNATVVVTMTLDTLMGGLKAAGLDTGSGSHPDWPAGSPVRPGSSRSSSAATHSHWTSAGSGGSTPRLSGSRWGSGTRAAPPTAATPRPAAATRTSTPRGAKAVAPASRTACCTAPKHHGYAHDPRYAISRLPNGKVRFHRRE